MANDASKIEPASDKHQAAVPLVDLCSAADSNLCRRIEKQSRLRDEKSEKESTVYLICADGGTGGCIEPPMGGNWLSPATAKEEKIIAELDAVLRAGNPQTKMDPGPGIVSLYKFLHGGSSPTSRAPMRADRQLFWEKATRPFEIKLVESLARSTGPLHHSEMMQTALRVCENDRQMAILTMANFTKNMAAIERRQVSPEAIAPELKATYEKTRIDALFNRIEGFADDPTEKYNKESAIYHFYGAMFAATKLGPGASLGVFAYNNLNLRPLGYGGRSDRIIDSASRYGAQFWWGMTPSERAELQAQIWTEP
jgi:hypothetical protein